MSDVEESRSYDSATKIVVFADSQSQTHSCEFPPKY